MLTLAGAAAPPRPPCELLGRISHRRFGRDSCCLGRSNLYILSKLCFLLDGAATVALAGTATGQDARGQNNL